MNDGVKKNPYKGIIIICILLIAVPIGLYFLFKEVIFSNQGQYSSYLNNASAICLGFGVGFIFQMSCVIGGLFRGSFSVVVKRVFNFFADLTISFKYAIRMYWDDIVENGVVFWIILPIILATLGVTLYYGLEVISLL